MTRPQLAQVLPTHPHLRHPVTGDALRAIGLTRGGKAIWPVMGGSQPNGEPTPAPVNPPAPPPAPAPAPAPAPPPQPAPIPTPSQVFPPPPQQPQPQQSSADPDLTGLTAVISELGLTPGQIKGRLEASRKWEDRAKEKDPAFQALKEKADKFDEMQTAAMSEQEKAVAAARQEGRAAALAEAGGTLAASALRTSLQLTGRLAKEQIDALLAPLDTKAFLADDGMSVDADKVTAYVNVVAPAPVAPAPTPAAPAATPPAAAQPATGAARQVPDMGQGKPTGPKANGLEAGREIARARFNKNQPAR